MPEAWLAYFVQHPWPGQTLARVLMPRVPSPVEDKRRVQQAIVEAFLRQRYATGLPEAGKKIA